MIHLQRLLKSQGVPESYPIAIVGSLYRTLKSQTELPIRRVTTGEELFNLVSNYTGVRSLGIPLLIEDLAYLPPSALQLLLKFLEESTLNIVLLSTYDVLSPALLSRIKHFIKAPIEKTQSNLLPPKKGRERIESVLSSDTHPLDRIRYQGKESPALYRIENQIPRRPNRAKLLNIIE